MRGFSNGAPDMKLLVNFESLYPSLPPLTCAVPVLPKMFHVLLRALVAVPRTTTSHNTRRTSIAVAGSSTCGINCKLVLSARDASEPSDSSDPLITRGVTRCPPFAYAQNARHNCSGVTIPSYPCDTDSVLYFVHFASGFTRPGSSP